MVTVLRASGFRIVIYANDHDPAHVHVFGDGEVKVQIAGPECELLWAFGMSRSDVRAALRLVVDNKEFLLSRWREIHG